MKFKERLLAQVRKPSGIFGKIVLWLMNRGPHAELAEWGLSHIKINPENIILDVGCGGGANVKRLAERVPEGLVIGIDYSEVSIEFSKKLNQEFIKQKRVKIEKASVSSLPYDENYFDIVTGFESYYFWPDLINDLREIQRILKPKGIILLINEAYKCKDKDLFERNKEWAEIGNFELYTPEEFRDILKKANFSQIEIYEEIDRGYIAIKAIK